MQVIPVLNCADAACVREKIAAAKYFLPEGEFLHLDVTDGSFTFHKTWNNPTEWANLRAPYRLEVHLMVYRPEKMIEQWIAAGAKRFVVHVETINEKSLGEILKKCDGRGVEVMLSSNPETKAEEYLPYRTHVSQFQVLAVHPGPAAQNFLPVVLEKIKFLRRFAPNATIEVDGGITNETALRVKDAGADIVVSASFIFGSEDPQTAYQILKAI